MVTKYYKETRGYWFDKNKKEENNMSKEKVEENLSVTDLGEKILDVKEDMNEVSKKINLFNKIINHSHQINLSMDEVIEIEDIKIEYVEEYKTLMRYESNLKEKIENRLGTTEELQEKLNEIEEDNNE